MFPLFNQKTTKAKLVLRNETPCLLAVFKESAPPMIWQFDLEKMASHTILLREKDGEWDLGLMLPQGTFSQVAHFEERGAAEEAYRAVAHTMLHDVRGNKAAHGGFRRFVGIVLALVAALFLWGFLMGSQRGVTQNVTAVQSSIGDAPLTAERAPAFPSAAEQAAPQATPSRTPAKIETGVPVTADDVLQSPAD